MMNIPSGKIARGELRVHFIGIGGAGSAPLAAILRGWNCPVSGSDSAPSPKLQKLAASGVAAYIGHRAEQVPANADLVVFSSAVPPDNPERVRARMLGIPELRRGAFLAMLSRDYRHLAAVSGSHGKSSVSAMLSFILRRCGMDAGYLIGAETDFPSSMHGDGEWFVTEVDESDGTHTLFRPSLGILTNIDDDHEWSLGGPKALFANYRTFAESSEVLLDVANAFPRHPDRIFPDREKVASMLPEWFGFALENAATAIRAAEFIGIPAPDAAEALRHFSGVKRRMTTHFQNEKNVLVEDYAHHPAELAASLDYLRKRYPGYHLTAIFQPHRYARLQKYLDRFAALLRTVDQVFIPPVFAAWSESGLVDHHALAELAGSRAHAVSADWSELARMVCAARAPGQKNLIAVIGAGDVNQVIEPIKILLESE